MKLTYLLFCTVVASIISTSLFGQECPDLAGEESFVVSPDHIEITDFYNGSMLNVSIVTPKDYDIVLKFVGKNGKIDLNKKGRIGIFWMNVGEIIIENVPNVYQLFTSLNLLELCPPEVRLKTCLGYEALMKQMKLRGEYDNANKIMNDFLTFKEKSGTYKINNQCLQPEKIINNCNYFSFKLPVSSNIPPGQYSLEVYYFYKGGFVNKLSKDIVIEKSGVTAFVSKLAVEHGAVYGIFAIVIAMISGFSIGIFFNSLKKRR